MMARRIRSQRGSCGDIGRSIHVSSRMTIGHRRVAQGADDALWSRAVPRPSGLNVATHHDGNAVIVAIAGELDLATAEPVREAVAKAMSQARQRLIIDLGGLTFIDSSGLHAILDAYKLSQDVVPAFTIRPGPPNVQLVFALTNLLDRLPFEISG